MEWCIWGFHKFYRSFLNLFSSRTEEIRSLNDLWRHLFTKENMKFHDKFDFANWSDQKHFKKKLMIGKRVSYWDLLIIDWASQQLISSFLLINIWKHCFQTVHFLFFANTVARVLHPSFKTFYYYSVCAEYRLNTKHDY